MSCKGSDYPTLTFIDSLDRFIMRKNVDINLVTKEDMFLEMYSIILGYFKDIVNSNDYDYIEFLHFDLEHKIKYFLKLKYQLLNRKDSYYNERV